MARNWDPERARAIIDDLRHLDGAALPILHALQREFGHVDRAVIPDIAQALNLSRAEIHGTLTFYHDFREAPAPGRVIRLCRAEACQAQGCESLRARAEVRLGVPCDGGPGRGGVSLESVYCLGNCALGPAALVDGELIGRLDEETVDALCAGAAVGDLLTDRESVS